MSKDALRRSFDVFDSNRDGKISAAELCAILTRKGSAKR